MKTILTDQNNALDLSRLMKADDVAELLNISRSYVYQLMQSGLIPTVRMGKAYRVRPQDLANFIEKNIHCKVENR